MKSVNNENHIWGKSGAVHTSRRVERLLHFLRYYKELWYKNGRSLEEKIDLIASNSEEKTRIMALYNQAETDFSILRQIRSRFYKQGKQTTPTYDISEEQIEELRQAGIGRTFGLSDENQMEYNRLINLGVDKDVVSFIFKKFTNYKRFKEVYCEAMEQGSEKELLKACYKAYGLCISDIDLSIKDGIRETDRNYIDLLRDVLGVRYFVFDGRNLVSRMEEFINFELNKTRTVLNNNEKYIIRGIYGLGTKKKSSEELRKELGLSNSRVRQILDYGLSKLSNRKSQLYDIVYLSDQREAVRFLINYFKKNDIFRVRSKEQEIEAETNSLVKTGNAQFDGNICSIAFAQNLKTKISEIDDSRAVISAMLKISTDDQLGRFENINFQEFNVGKMSIEKFNVSKRTKTCLIKGISNSDYCCIRDVIEYSRDCSDELTKKIKFMGIKSYSDLKLLMRSLGLKLEDTDKSEETRIQNDKVLSGISKIDAAKFYLYLEQLRYKSRSGVLLESSQKEIDERINTIENLHGIKMSNDDLTDTICSKIDLLGYQFDYDTSIEIFDIPYGVIIALKSNGINHILDIFRLRDRDVSNFKKSYGVYFDLIVAELNRMGLTYPLTENVSNNPMKHATYMNKLNVEFISFLIKESSLDEKKKMELNRMLLNKIKEIEKISSQDVDEELLDKIEQLRDLYKKLNEKEAALFELKSKYKEINGDANDDLGDRD